MATFSFGASAKPKPNPAAPFAGAVAGAPITGFDIGKAFIEQGNQQNAQKAVQATEQRKFQSGVIHGRHLGTGGYEGGNSAGPTDGPGNPFTNGFFVPRNQREGLQSLTPDAVGAREQAGLGLPNTGRPSAAGGVVTDRETMVNPGAAPMANFDQAAELAAYLGIAPLGPMSHAVSAPGFTGVARNVPPGTPRLPGFRPPAGF